MNLGIIVGHNASLPLGFIKSLLSVAEYPRIIQEGPSISDNRNRVFERARMEGSGLLFIDSDMVFTPSDVQMISDHLEEKDIVTGVCVMSFPGFPPSVFKKQGRTYKPVEDMPNEPFEIDCCGAAFLGISNKVIQMLTEPFTPIFEEKYGQFFGEDVSFCIRAKQNGFKIWCDPSLQIGHIKTDVKYYGKT